MIFRLFAPFEYLAAWFFFLFHNVALFRFAIEAAAAGVLIITVVGVYEELQQRKADRGVRVATLFAQIAQIQNLPSGKSSWAIKAAVEALARENVPMLRLDLSGANLHGANLNGAYLRSANLSDADRRRKPRGRQPRGANLSGTDLMTAEGSLLAGANLSETSFSDLSDAILADADLTPQRRQFQQCCTQELEKPHKRTARESLCEPR